MKLFQFKKTDRHIELKLLFIKIKLNLVKLGLIKFKTYDKLHKIGLYNINNYTNSDVITKNAKKILIIGRNRLGDSIGVHTKAFFGTLDFVKGEIYFYDEYTKILFHCPTAGEFIKILETDITNIDASIFDMLLYLNVLFHDLNDPIEMKLPHRLPLISMCYCVFDGTIPPKNWVSYINQYFDALLVPVKPLIDIFKDNGVVKPIFEIAVAQDYSSFLNENKKLNNKYRFGWVGFLEKRKNPMKILQAFSNIFPNREDIELIMHARGYNKNDEYAKNFLNKIKKAPSNVKFSCELLSDEENKKLINSFDCCIYPSVGEGFSNVPRESLASGSCVILSDIHTHKSITTLGEDCGICWLASNIEIPAIQPSLNNQQCGFMYDFNPKELEEKLIYIYENRDLLFTKEKIQMRKNVGRLYDKESLKSKYNTLVFPEDIIKSDENNIENNILYINDEDLYVKYNYYSNRNKKNIIIQNPNDAGFFSMFNQYMSHLVYAEPNDFIIPDWRVRTLKANVERKYKRLNFESFCYGKEEDGNIFLKFFKPPYQNIDYNMYQTDLMYTVADKILEIDDYNHLKEPNLTYINSYNLYKDKEYFPIFRKKYNKILNKFIQLNDELQERIKTFYQMNMAGYLCISIHVRCQAHATELLEQAPTFEKYNKHILQILNEKNITKDSNLWRLFIASDNDGAIKYFEHLYPNNVIYQKNVKRLSIGQEEEYKQMKELTGKDFAGLELQHRCAKEPVNHTLKMGEDIISDAYLLAKGEYFIYVNSNISTAVSYINPEINMLYCD